MTPEKAAQAYDILVREAGAAPGDRSSFILHLSKPSPPTEYRFQGHLGFGGKFRLRQSDQIAHRVDCYPEDLDPERIAIVERTNAALATLDAEDRPEYVDDPDVVELRRYRAFKNGAAA
ncbi:MAG: hypothetical protein DI537_10425 [Stutzerimonas stutzeri]|nr:MAG: hypothetical protein DI537_10425 [Stutzerimonas stutzeri]